MELPKKVGLDNLQGAWQKSRGSVFWGGGSYRDALYDLIRMHART